MSLQRVEGDLLAQPVEALVNPWNRNVIPWWLLSLRGVSRAIQQAAGDAPFRELAAMGPIPLGEGRITSAGRLPVKALLHVAGIDLLWRTSEATIEAAGRSVLKLARAHGLASVACPLIGAGSLGGSEALAEATLTRLFEAEGAGLDLRLVVLPRRR